MTTVQKNKLIAEFMGATFHKSSRVSMAPQDVWLPIHGICRWDTIDLGRGKILQYHKSWDWLIPVISKITSDESYAEYKDLSSSMVSDGGIDINTKFISVTYENVFDFIDWYSKQS
jgi:hypothetical protein